MKLTKNIKVNVYEVLADYKVKINYSPFIAILKFAEEKGGTIELNLLYKELLQPLSEKACENLLDRLSDMGYFERKDNYPSFNRRGNRYRTIIFSKNTYHLTSLGYNAAQKEEFYEDRRGILKIYITDSEFISQKIIKVKELKEDSFRDEDTEISNLNGELKSLQNKQNIVSLKNGSFIFDKFESKCRILKPEEKQLAINTDNHNSKITILDYESYIEKNTNQIRAEILSNYYSYNYDKNNNILRVRFNKKDLSLVRNIEIEKPSFQNNIFNPLKIENIKVSPKNLLDSKDWYINLVIENINKYYLSDDEFNSFANKVADKFELYKEDLKESICRQYLIKQLNIKQNFYKKAKLETIDYLNY